MSQVIDAPREQVFQLFMDPDRRSEWNPTARGILEQSGPLNEAGTRYVVDTRFGPFEVHVLRVEPPELVEMLEGVGRRGEAHVSLRLVSTADGRTLLTSGRFELRRFKRVAERPQ